MPAAIGAVSPNILRGNVMPPSQRVETWFVPGQAGIGAQRMGQNQSTFRYLAIFYAADPEPSLAALAALQGQVVSITDDIGETRSNMLIVRVGIPRRFAVVHEGTQKVRAEVDVEGVATGTSV